MMMEYGGRMMMMMMMMMMMLRVKMSYAHDRTGRGDGDADGVLLLDNEPLSRITVPSKMSQQQRRRGDIPTLDGDGSEARQVKETEHQMMTDGDTTAVV